MAFFRTLKLKRFTIFTNFEYNFHRNLNFIVAFNGQGKSSILNAILIALGYQEEELEGELNYGNRYCQGDRSAKIHLVIGSNSQHEVAVAVKINPDGRTSYRYTGPDNQPLECDRGQIRHLLEAMFPDNYFAAFISPERERMLFDGTFPREILQQHMHADAPWNARIAYRYIIEYWKTADRSAFLGGELARPPNVMATDATLLSAGSCNGDILNCVNWDIQMTGRSAQPF